MRYLMSGYANLIGKIWIKQIFISVTPAEVMLKLNDRLLRQRVRTQLRNQALSEKDSKIDKNLVESYTDDQIKTKFHRLLAEKTLLREQDEFEIASDYGPPTGGWKEKIDPRIATHGIEYVGAQNNPIYVRSIAEGDYEYSWHHDEEPEEDRDRSSTDYTAFPRGALKIAITKSSKSSASRENPRYVSVDNPGYDTIRELILRWNEAQREEQDEERAEDAAQAEQDETAERERLRQERIDLVNNNKSAAEQLGIDLAESFAYDYLSQDPGAPFSPGIVYHGGTTNAINGRLSRTWREAEELFSYAGSGDPGVEAGAYSYSYGGGAYFWNAFNNRFETIMRVNTYPYGWGAGWYPHEVFKWSKNNITANQTSNNGQNRKRKAKTAYRQMVTFRNKSDLPGRDAWGTFNKYPTDNLAPDSPVVGG